MPAATASRTVATHSSNVVGPHSMPSPPPPRVKCETGQSRPRLRCSIAISLHLIGEWLLWLKRGRAQGQVFHQLCYSAAEIAGAADGERYRRGDGAAGQRGDDLLDHPRAQLLAFSQRHDAV